jgi:hypothetical protein
VAAGILGQVLGRAVEESHGHLKVATVQLKVDALIGFPRHRPVALEAGAAQRVAEELVVARLAKAHGVEDGAKRMSLASYFVASRRWPLRRNSSPWRVSCRVGVMWQAMQLWISFMPAAWAA